MCQIAQLDLNTDEGEEGLQNTTRLREMDLGQMNKEK